MQIFAISSPFYVARRQAIGHPTLAVYFLLRVSRRGMGHAESIAMQGILKATSAGVASWLLHPAWTLRKLCLPMACSSCIESCLSSRRQRCHSPGLLCNKVRWKLVKRGTWFLEPLQPLGGAAQSLVQHVKFGSSLLLCCHRVMCRPLRFSIVGHSWSSQLS